MVPRPPQPRSAAPILKVDDRKIVAVEHPMIIQDIDKGIKTFGNNRPFKRVLDTEDPEECVPLYLSYNNPMTLPILSHHAVSNNVLLKITVPKRTGRKRKRGSKEPFQGDIDTPPPAITPFTDTPNAKLRSYSRLDRPKVLMRTLRENPTNYTVQAVGELKVTHRYRGTSEFHHSVENTAFYPKFRDNFLPGHVGEMRNFKFDKAMGWKTNEEFIPGPSTTSHPLPFNWAWQQNSNIFSEVDEETGVEVLINRSKAKTTHLMYIPNDVENVPTGPPHDVPGDTQLLRLIQLIQQAMEERPIWTRRSLLNRFADFPGIHAFKPAIQATGYQFRGGPFRDAIIKFGLDPRTDSKYRKYQTFFFKIHPEEEKQFGAQWHDVRSSYALVSKRRMEGKNDSHLFNGKSLTLDGRIWQICDITDPFLVDLVQNAPLSSYDPVDGYFLNGTMAKLKAIMKTKLLAIRTHKDLMDTDFQRALDVPDYVPDRTSNTIRIPLPDVRLTNEELEKMRSMGKLKFIYSNGLEKSRLKNKPRNERIRKQINPRTEGITRPGRGSRGVMTISKPEQTPSVGLFAEPSRRGSVAVLGGVREASVPPVGVFHEPSRAGSVMGDDANVAADIYYDSEGDEIDMETSEEGSALHVDDADEDDHDDDDLEDEGTETDIESREMSDG